MEPERPWSLEAVVAETRVDVRGLRGDVDELKADVHELRTEVRSESRVTRADLGTDIAESRSEYRCAIAELRQDFRRLDDRFFQMMLLQIGTLVAALASVVTAIVT